MRLVSCHIENFGNLQDYDYSFDQDKSIIHEDNGWGKSTLATFIRVMFFGFIGENKRSITDNERKKFKPWQMGTYGGNIVFSVNGKEYRIERRFGDKKSGSDEFELYDNRINIKSDDYSSNIGEELFGIDVDSFMRTVFIAQQDCGTDVTPDINAKIGKVSDQTADMGNYDDVQNALKKEMDRLTPDRVTGLLCKWDLQITELKEKVRSKENYINNIKELEERLSEQIDNKAKKNKDLQDLQEEIARLSSLKDSQANAVKYNELCEQENKAKKKYDEIRAFFPGEVPEKADVDAAIKICDEYEDSIQTVNNFSLSNEENKKLSLYEESFKAGIPSENLFDQVEESIEKLSKLEAERNSSLLSDTERKRLAEAERLFEDYKPTLEELDELAAKWSDRKSKKEALSAKKLNAELINNPNNANKSDGSNKTLGLILLIFGLVALSSGCITIVFVNSVAIGAAVAALGAVVAIAGLFLSFKKINDTSANQENAAYTQLLEEIASDEAFISDVEQVCMDVFSKLRIPYSEYVVQSEINRTRELVKDYDDLLSRNQNDKSADKEAEIKSLMRYISGFLNEYKLDVNNSDYNKAFYQLRHNAAEYSQILSKQKKMHEAQNDGDTISNKVRNFITGLGFEVDNDLKNQLSVIKDNCISLDYSRKDFEEKTKEKEEFEKINDIEKIKEVSSATESISIEELTDKFKIIKEQIDVISELEENYRNQIEGDTLQLENIENYEAELSNLQEEYVAAKRKYDIIVKTRDYLEKAKHNFSSKYMDDIKESFEKYHNIISDSEEKYELDANLNIKLLEKGSLHEIKLLSEGYQDLVGLCRRMAMVDAMYDHEKPFLIFDDPFVNLDESRLAGAMKFMDIVSKEYQIVYFSCHQSRC